MSIEVLLKELVSKVNGATGAIILEADGEAVQLCAPASSERLRLRGAYIAVVLRSCRAAAARSSLAGLSSLVLGYDGANFVAQEIDRDCFVVLELEASANIGEAMFRLEPAVEKLREEFGA